MKIYAGSRMNGKTSELLASFLEDQRGVFVTLPSQVKELKKAHPRVKQHIISYITFLNGRFKNNANVYIDEAQRLLEAMQQGYEVKAIALPASGPPTLAHHSTEALRKIVGSEVYEREYPVEHYRAKGSW